MRQNSRFSSGNRAIFDAMAVGLAPGAGGIETFTFGEGGETRMDQAGYFPEFAGREQELFTWLNLVGRCPQCSEVLRVADFECA